MKNPAVGRSPHLPPGPADDRAPLDRRGLHPDAASATAGRLPAATLAAGTTPAGKARHYASALYSACLGTAALRPVDAAPRASEDYIAALPAAFGMQP